MATRQVNICSLYLDKTGIPSPFICKITGDKPSKTSFSFYVINGDGENWIGTYYFEPDLRSIIDDNYYGDGLFLSPSLRNLGSKKPDLSQLYSSEEYADYLAYRAYEKIVRDIIKKPKNNVGLYYEDVEDELSDFVSDEILPLYEEAILDVSMHKGY